jgi:hypothetical protein
LLGDRRWVAPRGPETVVPVADPRTGEGRKVPLSPLVAKGANWPSGDGNRAVTAVWAAMLCSPPEAVSRA